MCVNSIWQRKYVAQSSTKAKCVPLWVAHQKDIWTHWFLQGTKCFSHTITLHGDNKLAIMTTKQQKYSEKSMHVHLKKYFMFTQVYII